MIAVQETPVYSKYRWSEISRVNPPKRPAAERVGDFREVVHLFDQQTIRAQASRCLNCPQPQCVEGCPLQNRIPEWLAAAAEGSFLEAAAISRTTSNIPEICSRVCPQEKLCEGACVLNARSQPVAIGAVEKFINEYALTRQIFDVTRQPFNGLRVAVVGAGPGGLACADELAKLGYAVTVFEALPKPGGLLVYGIPSFKLEKSVVERRVRILERRGIVFRTHTKIGRDISFDELRKQFASVFIGIGAQRAKRADIPGESLNGVHAALPFLIQKNVGTLNGQEIDVKGKRVAVLGGGDTAMDCLRTALRAGAAEAVCIYRRDLANMPGSRKEYYNSVEEGARFEFLTNPEEIEGERQVSGVRCTRMELGEADLQGRRKPIKVRNSETVIPADIVLVAYGFDSEPAPQFESCQELATDRWGALQVDDNQMTSLPGVFAGGDSARGASLVVHAVRDGRIAARGIHSYLG